MREGNTQGIADSLVLAPLSRGTAANTLSFLRDINTNLLTLMAEAASEPDPVLGLIKQLREPLTRTPSAIRDRLGFCPVLLLDAGFADPYRWRYVRSTSSRARTVSRYGAWLSRADGTLLALSVMQFTAGLLRTAPTAAAVFMGVTAECAEIIGSFSVLDMHYVARNHYDWFRPRWENTPLVWRRLFELAHMSDSSSESAAALYAKELFFGHSLYRPT